VIASKVDANYSEHFEFGKKFLKAKFSYSLFNVSIVDIPVSSKPVVTNFS
jgi:hypothetical protein